MHTIVRNALVPVALALAASAASVVRGDEAPAVAPMPAVAIMSAAALQATLAHPPADQIVLDVRTPEEFAAGHVPGARNIPVQQLESRLAELVGARSGAVVVYCRTGHRAGIALQILAAHGFARLAHLEGDMQGWLADGRPVEPAAVTHTEPPASQTR